MGSVVIGMIVVMLLGLLVMLAVAVPARRDGRQVLTPQGVDVLAKVRERTESVGGKARDAKDRTEDLIDSARQRSRPQD